MRLSTVLVITIAFSHIVAASKPRLLHRVKRVISGRNMAEFEFPWLVSISGTYWRFGDGFMPVTVVEQCGAALLNERWLVTAAHCFENRYLNASASTLRDARKWKAQLARKIFKQKKFYIWRVNIKRIIIHPYYMFKTGENGQLHYDIALLELATPVPYQDHQYMQPATLPTKTMSLNKWPPKGTRCTFAGWGCTRKGGRQAKFARKINFQIVSDLQCLYTYGSKYVNLKNDMCAGAFNGNKGICSGDSGGPLICYYNKTGRGYLAGIASATSSEAPEDFPGIFTRISKFRNWILETISANRTSI